MYGWVLAEPKRFPSLPKDQPKSSRTDRPTDAGQEFYRYEKVLIKFYDLLSCQNVSNTSGEENESGEATHLFNESIDRLSVDPDRYDRTGAWGVY